MHVYKILQDKKLKQREVADILGIAQPNVSQVMIGHFSRFTTDRLLGFLKRLDRKMTIEVSRHQNGEPYQQVTFAPHEFEGRSQPSGRTSLGNLRGDCLVEVIGGVLTLGGGRENGAGVVPENLQPCRDISGVECFNPRAPRGARPGGDVPRLEVSYCFNPCAPRGARRRRASTLCYQEDTLSFPRTTRYFCSVSREGSSGQRQMLDNAMSWQ